MSKNFPSRISQVWQEDDTWSRRDLRSSSRTNKIAPPLLRRGEPLESRRSRRFKEKLGDNELAVERRKKYFSPRKISESRVVYFHFLKTRRNRQGGGGGGGGRRRMRWSRWKSGPTEFDATKRKRDRSRQLEYVYVQQAGNGVHV